MLFTSRNSLWFQFIPWIPSTIQSQQEINVRTRHLVILPVHLPVSLRQEAGNTNLSSWHAFQKPWGQSSGFLFIQHLKLTAFIPSLAYGKLARINQMEFLCMRMSILHKKLWCWALIHNARLTAYNWWRWWQCGHS